MNLLNNIDVDTTVSTDIATDIEDQNQNVLPDRFTLSQNYPNPFNPSTTINYALPTKSHVVIKVYNVLGQEIRTLVDHDNSAGFYSVLWNGKDNFGKSVTSGIYLYRIETDDFDKSMKMILLK